MTLILNGLNLSNYVNPFHVFDYIEKVQGPNAGVSMGGVDIFDTIKIRHFLEVEIGLLPRAQYTQLAAISNIDYATVQYTDPQTGSLVIRAMSVNLEKQQRIEDSSGNVYHKNIIVTLRER